MRLNKMNDTTYRPKENEAKNNDNRIDQED
jgi:hypothetical protein